MSGKVTSRLQITITNPIPPTEKRGVRGATDTKTKPPRRGSIEKEKEKEKGQIKS